jgi:hypothetical protein
MARRHWTYFVFSVAALGCTSATSPETLVTVQVENPVFSVFQGRSKTLVVDARITNASSHSVSPSICATVQVERESSPGVFTNVTAQLECAAAGSSGPVIAPHSELVLRLSAQVVLDAAPLGETYRVQFPIFVDGKGSSRTVTSDSFIVSAQTGT